MSFSSTFSSISYYLQNLFCLSASHILCFVLMNFLENPSVFLITVSIQFRHSIRSSDIHDRAVHTIFLSILPVYADNVPWTTHTGNKLILACLEILHRHWSATQQAPFDIISLFCTVWVSTIITECSFKQLYLLSVLIWGIWIYIWGMCSVYSKWTWFVCLVQGHLSNYVCPLLLRLIEILMC